MNAEGMRLFTLAVITELCKATTDDERLSIIASFLYLIDETDLMFSVLGEFNGANLSTVIKVIERDALGGSTFQTYLEAKRKAEYEGTGAVE